MMTVQEVQAKALNLPVSERVKIAKALWSSIEEPQAEDMEQRALKEAMLRREELKTGQVKGRSHEQVIQAARRAIL